MVEHLILGVERELAQQSEFGTDILFVFISLVLRIIHLFLIYYSYDIVLLDFGRNAVR